MLIFRGFEMLTAEWITWLKPNLNRKCALTGGSAVAAQTPIRLAQQIAAALRANIAV
jgi:hypothetical protein